MKHFFLCLFMPLVLVGCVPKKYLHYNEVKNNLATNKFSKILIVGTGTSGTNLFLETLSEELNKRLKQKKIETVYYHLGNNQAGANTMFKEITGKTKFDAVLQFAQLDETNNPIFLTSGAGGAPVGNGSSIMYSYQYRAIRFHQKFLMRYFEFSDLSNSMLDVNLDVKIDFINPRDYSKLSDYVIRSLRIE